MRRLLVMMALGLAGTVSVLAQVPLKSEGQDSAYVQTILGRAQRLVDKLNIADPAKALDVRNIIANRYFLVNDIHDKYQGASCDSALYVHHFELETALSAYLDADGIETVKDGITFGRLPRDYQAQLEMIPTLTDEEKAQVLAWLKEAREYAMDGGTAKQKHYWFDKYRGRTNNWLSARGYDLNKERADWQKRIAGKQKQQTTK